MTLKAVCVFCGSQPGRRAEYVEAARETGRLLATNGIELVYGGGHVGLMGAMADAALASGGRVTGVIPDNLMPPEVAHLALTELLIVTRCTRANERWRCEAMLLSYCRGALAPSMRCSRC